jgi:glycosyltransferase involved in cell wall biosynthesis
MFVGPPGPSAAGVSYHTGVGDEELASLYRRAWLYVSPRTYEGFGLPYLEAMACGTPVVCTPNPGSREVLADGIYGRLVDDDLLAPATLELLGDQRKRGAMAIAGLRRAREYSLDAMIDHYEALLGELCGGGADACRAGF